MSGWMRVWDLIVRTLAIGCLLLAGSRLSVAAEEDDSLYGPSAPQPAYPIPSPGGNIIGYKPIPESALGAVLAAPSQMQVTGQAGQVTSQVGPATGAQGQGQVNPLANAQFPAQYLTGIMVGDGLYTLGRDDIIRVAVRNQPEFSGDFIIGYDGRIRYNYLGDIPVTGLTKYEVQQVLEKMLQQFVRVPAVNVQIMAYNSKAVYVIGEVNHPGKFIMRGDAIKLREAILAAGLPTRTAALGRVHVIKPDLNKPHVRIINLKKILYKGKLQDDVDLAAGEIVVVPSTVLSKVNDFLSSLLSPVTRAASVAALAAL